MPYSGSFNRFSFGNKARPGASVATLSGWRGRKADVPIVEGAGRIAAGPARILAGDPRLGLNLHADSPSQLDTLIDAVVGAFTPTNVPLPLTIEGWSMWCQVTDCAPATNPDWPGAEKTTSCPVQFKSADPVLYSAETTVTFGSPVSTSSFQVANTGLLVPRARRAFAVSLTASGTTTNPKIRVDHADGTFEQITFQGLTMTSGQVLTIGSDGLPRVNGVIKSGYMRSLTERGVTSRAPRWWLLHKSTGADSKNQVTVSVASGAFTGTFKTRSTK